MRLGLVIGGASSGKSEYAEMLAVDMASRLRAASLVYIATMAAGDEESLKRIEAHRRRRAGRGFRTIEKPADLSSVKDINGAVILLEDLSNLAANELFAYKDGVYSEINPKTAYDNITGGIRQLMEKCRCLIAVTGNIFEDGGMKEGSMLNYERLLGAVNFFVAMKSDLIAEVTCGISMSIKGNPDAACDTALGIGSISGRAVVAATGSSDATIGGHPEITTDGDSGRTVGGMGAKKPVGRGLPGKDHLPGKGHLPGKDHLPGKGHLPGKDHLPGEGSCGPAIILVTGGFCQGKTAFAGSKAATMKQTGMERIVIVDDYQEHVRCRLLQEMKHEGEREAPGRFTGQRESGLGYGEELALELLNKLEDEGASAAIVVSALPCAGPVPADPFERRWRDEVGKACQVLAAHSAEVYRVLCGIPQRLK